ncbi:hypothetical protein MYAM1_000370 [Malassezia yamatoensis]|uniref:Fatty acid hydroxylase domain-containing protein n=1 Tax=Malassezia yamatoensis TaxID=253288 RepID=A0AAJ5YPD5_9BASI|nr:hypothetical protein MYAM1_000370 [Malassezia yamatoensis]
MSAASANRPRPHADAWLKNKSLPIIHRVIRFLEILPPASDEVPQHDMKDKVPVFSEINQALYLVPCALLPFAVRYAYYHYVDQTMPNPWIVWVLLFTYTLIFGARFVRFQNRLAKRYGYLDGGVGRDTVPYSQVTKVAMEAVGGLTLRPALVVLCAYDPNAPPSLSVWLPVQLFVFTLVEDFYYYWLHRACHEAQSAWHFHRLHHTTKHPTSLLLGYADEIQECFDIFLVPFMAWLTFPLNFDAMTAWIIIHISIQLHGHSGVRLHYGTILTGPFLRPLGLELICEDHDLHHRHGWKDSYNYGKQSRVWDTLFGTGGERIECVAGNLENRFI